MNEELNNNQNIEGFSDDYAEALESVPPEVRAFMWSEAFDLLLKKIGDLYKLTDNQRGVLREVVIKTLIGIVTPVSRQVLLSDAGIKNETQDQILEIISEEIISRALTQIEEYKDLNTEDKNIDNLPRGESETAPSPTQALEAIKERLSQSTKIAPTKRDYSLGKTENATPSVQNISKPTIDPYRELPEKE